jgi:hypothetical protein
LTSTYYTILDLTSGTNKLKIKRFSGKFLMIENEQYLVGVSRQVCLRKHAF